MRISILGAGAIGGYFAGALGAANADVQVIARGETLEAIRRNGVQVEGHVTATARPPAFAIEEAPPADVLVSCVKAHALPGLAAGLAALLKPDGLWLCVVNGVPWWYDDQPLNAVDPGAAIRSAFPIVRTAGGVAYLRCETLRPGVIAYTGGNGLIIGMPSGAMPPLQARLAEVFTAAGIATRTTPDIRSAFWNKLFGNAAMNPLSALTGYTVAQLLADPELKRLLAEMIGETMSVARAEGARIDSTVEQRMQAMTPLGQFRTSMLQDVDASRPIELDGILGAVIEVADRRGVAVPASCRVYALVRAFAASRGLLPS
jgi:2-dehydropantoate 2-reductase